MRIHLPIIIAAAFQLAHPLDRNPVRSARAQRQLSDQQLVAAAKAWHRTANPARATATSQGNAALTPGVSWDAIRGTPRFLDGRFLRKPSGALSKTTATSALAIGWINANRGLFRLDDPGRELFAEREWTDATGRRHAVFSQRFQGIPVWGQEMGAHFDRDGKLYSINAGYEATPRGLAAFGYHVGEDRAKAVVLADLARLGLSGEMGDAEKAVLDYKGPVAGKTVWLAGRGGRAHWAWHVSVRPNFRDRWEYFVDGVTGVVLERYNATTFDGPATATATDLLGVSRTLNTYKIGSAYHLIDASRKTFNPKSNLPADPRGALWTLDARNTDLSQVFHATSANNTWTDPAAVSAHYNMGRVFEYFSGTHGRLGIDGAGSTVISAVHVTAEGKKLDNAYWNGKCMAYGDGDRQFSPLARSLDVAAHEMTHGVIEKTVNLEYKFQSGALNESLADVFGAMVDRDDWKLGEDVALPAFYPGSALRDMQDPHNGGSSANDASWQPANMSEFVQLKLDQDNGGVHVNSGIPNRACYLLATAIGREKTEKIYYRVLDAHYLNSTSQFIDMRLAAIRAAVDLHGEASAEVAAVKTAFDQVGIVDKAATERPADAPAVQGQEFLAIVNAEGTDKSLYLARTQVKSDTDLAQATPTQVFTGTGNPIAVPEDGSVVIFIDADNNLRAIDESTEEVVSATGTWKSIAISPNGAKIAATTVIPDAKIYILDLVAPDQSKALDLYTPTTGSGIKAENVVSADALDWNSTGEYLLFDAFNRVPKGDTGAIEFWNVNLIDVKTGVITPFYPTLPDGISIGNPSFAQNSDLVFAFDLYDANTGAYAVFAADMFTGETGAIDSNGTDFAYPRYSTDDRTMVYERVEAGSKNLVQAPMGKDRITRAGANLAYIKGGQRPTWFSIGKRPAGIPFRRPTQSALSLSWNPVTGLEYRLPKAGRIELSLRDMQGRLLAVLDQGEKAAGSHRAALGASPARGMYLFDLRARQGDGKDLRTAKRAFLK